MESTQDLRGDRSLQDAEPLAGSLPDSERGLPLCVTAPAPGTVLADWIAERHDAVMAARRKHGALRFRGFAVDQAQAFEDAARVIAPDLQCEYLGQSPRRKLSDYVFTSTELPPHYPIPQHAEMSFYFDRAPHSLFFWCPTPSAVGGATPLTDLRRVYRDLDPVVREAFETRGVRHIRAYKGPKAKHNFDVFQFKRWHEVYGTTDKAEVERIAHEAGDELVWDDDDRLTLYSTHPAVRAHPETGEMAWFNHSQVMHLAATPHELARQARLLGSPRLFASAAALKLIAVAKHRLLPADRQSYHVTYADGGEIPSSHIRHVCDVVWRNTVVQPWQRGDVLAIDNASVAHGRQPFQGERLVAVAWA
ncbi:TauD/TfdA family dioxygenase [Algiphilus aromaticivorans]|jgi:alpha-ketoglutarate-dependent taurine dioxygenase|uniref:TauD/TfdA family dioxygenase n=1 Tax=Algiphilus aromaticivorans TaxID=382454 RepID=UPI000693463F|nr:TauD/TfdA family dioxygenase [Algiphilus aromaticivorans]